MPTLYSPLTIGTRELDNRVIMAPLTRNRANHETDTPEPIMQEYYSQRASAGLIITEATQISPEGKGYIATPGIYKPEHVEAWSKITKAVHDKGGAIFMQLWHVGRISHTSLQPGGQAPLAPSAIAANAQTFIVDGPADTSMPTEITLDGIARTISDYKTAAQNAKDAGFDGVEIHGANGYLIDQFMRDKTNQRTDEYGGSIENRAKFLLEVIGAVTSVWQDNQVGLRLSPTNQFNDMADSDTLSHFSYIIDKLNGYNLAYLHMVEKNMSGEQNPEEDAIIQSLRNKWQGIYIANLDYDRARAEAAVEKGEADAIAFGKLFISNPDLPERLARNAPLNEADPTTFYGGGREGYTDYPPLETS